MRALRRGGERLAVLLLALGFSARAEARLILPDPSSRVYSTFAVAAGERIELESGVRVEGSLHSNGDADLKSGSSVSGNASASGALTGTGTVAGTRSTGVPPVALPALFDEAAARALADRVAETDLTFDTLQTVDDVLFVHGTVRFRAGLRGTGTVIATGSLLFDNVNLGHPVEPDPATRMSLVAFDDILVGKGQPLRAVFRAGRDVTFDKEARVAGVVVADRKVWIKGDSSVSFLPLDTEAPRLQLVFPQGSLVGTSRPTIRFSYSDEESGIAPETVRLTVDGADLTEQVAMATSWLEVTPPDPLAEGDHVVELRLADRAGNLARLQLVLTVDTLLPEVAIASPSGPLSEIQVSFSDGGSGLVLGTARFQIDGLDLTATCEILEGTAVCLPGRLAAGRHDILFEIEDRAANRGSASLSFEIAADSEAPTLTIVEPASPLLVGTAVPAIKVRYADSGSGIDLPSFRLSIDAVDITASCAAAQESAVCSPPALTRGAHVLEARIADTLGNLATARLDLAVTFPVAVAFTSPEPESVSASPAVQVRGTVSPDAVSVEVNGVVAVIGNGVFTIETLGLHDGANTLVAVARDAQGNVGTAAIRVFADTTLPGISLTSPVEGTLVTTSTVVVTGLVNDLTIGTVSDAEVAVTVNGRPAQVANRSFVAAEVPLVPGPNRIEATAVDRAGNQATVFVDVIQDARTGLPTLAAVAGDGQTGPVSTRLPQPLVVRVRDGAGQPKPGAQVVFRVIQGNGTLDEGERYALVTTNGQGDAAVAWTLGSRAGAGTDRVRATAPGVLGEVVFSAVSLPGEPASVHVLSGDNQRGAVGEELAQPLIAVVFDEGGNPVSGVPVTFQSTRGGGSFEGAASVVATTDSSGLASARLTLGAVSGLDNHQAEASLAGATVLPAVFRASGFVLGDPAETRIVGVVLDNQGEPVPGVTLRLRDSSRTAVADAQGQFRLTQVPVGRVFLIADASTTSRPGHWASLEFELFTLAGVENTLERPVYILPLDLSHGVSVDETHGGTVTIPEVPGFSLEIAPGSVTFPGGGRSGVVSVTAVHADKIPMAPGAGMQPRLIVTIQPAGAHFDPPAALTLPNVDGLPPGTVTEMFSFDHDIGAFVAIGTGTVSEDGLVLRSAPGFGVLEAGWHCGSPPGGVGASSTLGVSISTKEPVILCRDEQGQPVPQQLEASGGPPRDAVYTWESPGAFATLTPVGGGLCKDQERCDTSVVGTDQAGKGKAKVTITCTTTGKSAQDQIEILNPKVEILAVDICGNEIRTRLLPEDRSVKGTFTLNMVSQAGGSTRLLQEERTGGTYTDTFRYGVLPVRVELTTLEAVWNIGDCDSIDTEEAHFMYVGQIRHTQYNCPSSADPTCAGGGPTNVCFSDASCRYAGPEAVPAQWVDQVINTDYGTGCGSTPTRGDVQQEIFCTRNRPATGACQGLQAFRAGAAIVPRCANLSVGANTVAVHDTYLNGVLPCGTNICIQLNGGGVQKTVTDRCPACGTGRIDNFSTSGACGIGDLDAGAVTLRLYN